MSDLGVMILRSGKKCSCDNPLKSSTWSMVDFVQQEVNYCGRCNGILPVDYAGRVVKPFSEWGDSDQVLIAGGFLGVLARRLGVKENGVNLNKMVSVFRLSDPGVYLNVEDGEFMIEEGSGKAFLRLVEVYLF